MTSSYMKEPNRGRFHANWNWLFLWGILLVILGCAAISAASLMTIVSVIFLGCIILIGGIVILFDTFKLWWGSGSWGSFLLEFIMAVLYIVVGIMLIKNPVSASVSLTFLLGLFYLVIGLFRIIYALASGMPSPGYSVFSGFISALLGILILANWPTSGLFIIGLFIGVDLLVIGLTYIMTSLSIKSLAR